MELGNGELLIPSALPCERPNLPCGMFPEELVSGGEGKGKGRGRGGGGRNEGGEEGRAERGGGGRKEGVMDQRRRKRRSEGGREGGRDRRTGARAYMNKSRSTTP